MSAYDPNSNDAVMSRVLTQLEGLRGDFAEYRLDNEKRLRKLEEGAATERGKNVILSAIASVAVSFIVGLFKRS